LHTGVEEPGLKSCCADFTQQQRRAERTYSDLTAIDWKLENVGGLSRLEM